MIVLNRGFISTFKPVVDIIYNAKESYTNLAALILNEEKEGDVYIVIHNTLCKIQDSRMYGDKQINIKYSKSSREYRENDVLVYFKATEKQINDFIELNNKFDTFNEFGIYDDNNIDSIYEKCDAIRQPKQEYKISDTEEINKSDNTEIRRDVILIKDMNSQCIFTREYHCSKCGIATTDREKYLCDSCYNEEVAKEEQNKCKSYFLSETENFMMNEINGDHYRIAGSIDTIDKLYAIYGAEPLMWFLIGNIQKYRDRLGIKNDGKDLDKDISKIKKYEEMLNALLNKNEDLKNILSKYKSDWR